MDGDPSGDLLSLKWLKSRSFGERYAAMGVWDVVMSSKFPTWRNVFEYLGPNVAVAARKGVPTGDDWEDNREVLAWLKTYSRGKPSGKLSKHPFRPKSAGPAWYVRGADLDGDVLYVTMVNQFSGESKELNVYLNAPDYEHSRVENYGSKGDRQQSVLVTLETEEGEAEIQVDLDPNTGEQEGDLQWEGAY
jgi:hypothetical protein